MSRKWDKENPRKSKALKDAWRKKHPSYMRDYNKLLRLYMAGKIKLKPGEGLMDYRRLVAGARVASAKSGK